MTPEATETAPEFSKSNLLLASKFSKHVIMRLYLDGPQTKTALVNSMSGSSAKTLYRTVDELLAAGFMCQNGRVLEISDAGRQAAALYIELDKLEQTHKAKAVNIPELEKAVLKTISEFVGRPFPNNMCIRPYLGYVIRDAYPGLDYVDAERRPYSVVITETPSKIEPWHKSDWEVTEGVVWTKDGDVAGSVWTKEASIAPEKETRKEKLERIAMQCAKKKTEELGNMIDNMYDDL